MSLRAYIRSSTYLRPAWRCLVTAFLCVCLPTLVPGGSLFGQPGLRAGTFTASDSVAAKSELHTAFDADDCVDSPHMLLYAARHGLPVPAFFGAPRPATMENQYSYTDFGEAEIAGLAGGAGLSLLSHFFIGAETLTAEEIARLTPDSVRSVFPFVALDRTAAYRWNPDADALSDWGVYSNLAAPLVAAVFLLPDATADGTKVGTGDYLGSYAQTLAVGLGVNLLVKNLVARRRPYLFNPDVSAEDKMRGAPDYTRSFFSGHTTLAFSSAAFLTTTYWDMYPDRDSRYAVGIISFSTALVTGYLRYEAGKHFPSDIVVGALVGTALGVVLPQLN